MKHKPDTKFQTKNPTQNDQIKLKYINDDWEIIE